MNSILAEWEKELVEAYKANSDLTDIDTIVENGTGWSIKKTDGTLLPVVPPSFYISILLSHQRQLILRCQSKMQDAHTLLDLNGIPASINNMHIDGEQSARLSLYGRIQILAEAPDFDDFVEKAIKHYLRFYNVSVE